MRGRHTLFWGSTSDAKFGLPYSPAGYFPDPDAIALAQYKLAQALSLRFLEFYNRRLSIYIVATRVPRGLGMKVRERRIDYASHWEVLEAGLVATTCSQVDCIRIIEQFEK